MIYLPNGEIVAGQSKGPGSYHERSVPYLADGDPKYLGVPTHMEMFLRAGTDYHYFTSAFESSSAGRIGAAYKGLEVMESKHPDIADQLTICGSATLSVALHAYGKQPANEDTKGVVYYQKAAEGQLTNWLAQHPYLQPSHVEDSAEAPMHVLDHKGEEPAFGICPQAAGDLYIDDGLQDCGNASNKQGGTKFYLLDTEGGLDERGSHTMIKFKANHSAGGILLPLTLIADRHNLSDLAVYNVNGHEQVDVLAEVQGAKAEVSKTIHELHERGINARIFGQYTPFDERKPGSGETYEDYDFRQHTLDWGPGKVPVAFNCLDKRGDLTKKLQEVDRLGVNLLGLDVPIAPMNENFGRPIVVAVSPDDARKLRDNQERFGGSLMLPPEMAA